MQELLAVKLTSEELSLLDRARLLLGHASRSQTLREGLLALASELGVDGGLLSEIRWQRSQIKIGRPRRRPVIIDGEYLPATVPEQPA